MNRHKRLLVVAGLLVIVIVIAIPFAPRATRASCNDVVVDRGFKRHVDVVNVRGDSLSLDAFVPFDGGAMSTRLEVTVAGSRFSLAETANAAPRMTTTMTFGRAFGGVETEQLILERGRLTGSVNGRPLIPMPLSPATGAITFADGTPVNFSVDPSLAARAAPYSALHRCSRPVARESPILRYRLPWSRMASRTNY